ncbi:MAG: DEAD/DEAH box helicase, partial [Anaerolineae bacterium]|nr:DEAD/DEAH box helicase [Anaerolineae bacterium]
ELVGNLRQLLARSSLSALEPDLVILDEFQRFKYLLEDEGDVALLARELFDFPDVKVLLLSATPYKMYTLQAEAAEDHYGDFYRTVQFLLREQPEALDLLQLAIDRYRSGMLHLGEYGRGELLEAKEIIERILRKVMVRTERLAASADRNGMLSETLFAQDQVLPGDLEGFVHLDQIASALDAGDQVEYWKSSAYPLNLMDRYKLKRKFIDALDGPEDRELAALLKKARGHLLEWDTVEAYESVDPGNARLRAFWQDSVETGNWQLLWMPASLPYYRPAGPFRNVRPEGCTKSLIFSGWRVVPKTISVLLSYEAERRMLEETDKDFAYSELTKQRSPLLRFTLSRERLTGMRVFCLTYPCLALANAVDPLALAKSLPDGSLATQEQIFGAAKAQIGALLHRAIASAPFEGAG